MNPWLEVQEKIAQKYDFIAEIGVKTITLTRIGGYKATPYSLDLRLINEPNEKSLKGIWRWWARLAIVGAFGGRINYREANKYLNKIFGGDDEYKGISKFRLQISDVKFPDKNKLIEFQNIIEEFYNKAKKFLIDEYPEIEKKLPKNSEISISLNPSDFYQEGIIINHKTERLDRQKNLIEECINKGSLREYFLNCFLTKYNKRIICRLQFPKDKQEKLLEPIVKHLQIPRIRLLLMPRKGEKDRLQMNNIDSVEIKRYLERIKEEWATFVNEGLEFKILVFGDGKGEEINFAISSLLLSLILGGVGSITKRAFGSLKIISFKFRSDLVIKDEILELFDHFKNRDFTKEELKKDLEDLSRIVIECFENLLESRIIQKNEQDIGIVPSLRNIRIEVIECKECDLVRIGNAFVKQNWKKNCIEQGRDLHTWILGLPRRVENTGYAVKEMDNIIEFNKRRISSIGARCFTTNTKSFIILFGLLSKDWPLKSLLHIRKKNQRPPIEEKVEKIPIRQRRHLGVTGRSIKDVFDVAFSEISKRVCEESV
jgi:CRISPR type III-B/RAMP module RAMP protein Cmr1